MGTRTNFYKNPSITYKKDFSISSVLKNLRAYNTATGNAPSTGEGEQPPVDHHRHHDSKRRRQCSPKPPPPQIEVDDTGPMSHLDYIQKTRKELCSWRAYEELSEDVLGTSSWNGRLSLVDYERVNCSLDDVKGRILGRKPLPSIHEVFFEARQEECRKMLNKATPSSRSKADSSDLVPNLVFCGSDVEGDKTKEPWCDHCKRPWHMRETCWKIHGKPAHLQKKSDGRAFQTMIDSQEQSINSKVSPCTKEQLEHLYKLFKSPQLSITPSCSLAHQGDGSTSECEEKQGPSDSGREDESDRVKSRSEQRFPVPGEPVCVVCGKFGEYICNETDDDICSMECKTKLLQTVKVIEERSRNQTVDVSSSELKYNHLPVPEIEDTWDFNRNCWSKKRSQLCTYECWKCQRPGHLAEDCLAALEQNKTSAIPRDLLELYKRCHQIGRKSSFAKCNECRSSLTLATCLDCNTVFCDSAGHLNEHIKQHASHRHYYSHKLRRLVKCCKSTCKVTDINNLLACHYCLDKAFDKFYDMYTATWKDSGLSIIWGSICCEDHFEWHRMNCLNAGVEGNAHIIGRNAAQKHQSVQISDFIF